MTSRAGGVSAAPYDTFNLGGKVGDDPAAVAANRQRLAEHLGVSRDRLVWMNQVHSNEVRVVTRPCAVTETCDALVTATPGLVLGVLVADCVPLLFADAQAGVVAAVHAGRKGAQAGIALRALAAMQTLGSQPSNVDVLIGPAICGLCYEVPPEMQVEVVAQLPDSASTTRQGTAGLDLRQGLVRQLNDAGVGTVAVDQRCTAEDSSLFSYRRDNGVTGRQAGLVWLS